MDDDGLIVGVAAGEDTALRELFCRHAPWLLLAYLGLWALPAELPSWTETVSPYLLTRLWGEVTWAAVQGQATSLWDWLGLLAYGVGFAVLALWGYRRDDTARSA